VEGAPAAATAEGYGPDLLGRAVEALDELAAFAAGAARNRGGMAPPGLQALLGVEEPTPKRSPRDQDGVARADLAMSRICHSQTPPLQEPPQEPMPQLTVDPWRAPERIGSARGQAGTRYPERVVNIRTWARDGRLPGGPPFP
jgi:hypothetical protein